jgi:acyl-CoA thioesterase FadM
MMHVCAGVNRLGDRSITLGFTIDRQDGIRVADCEIVLVCVDRQTWKGKPVPEGLRSALAPFID